jgi:hypothetical protein
VFLLQQVSLERASDVHLCHLARDVEDDAFGNVFGMVRYAFQIVCYLEKIGRTLYVFRTLDHSVNQVIVYPAVL